jgi:hypothetical protein
MKKTIKILFLIFLFTVTNYGQTNNVKQEKNTNTEVVSGTNEWSAVSERVFTTVIVISELALLLGILFYWKKTRGESKVTNKNTFKKNIQALRLERIKYYEDEKLSTKRKTLYSKINAKTIDGRFITAKAKRLSISKGEIFLATRIRQLQAKT